MDLLPYSVVFYDELLLLEPIDGLAVPALHPRGQKHEVRAHAEFVLFVVGLRMRRINIRCLAICLRGRLRSACGRMIPKEHDRRGQDHSMSHLHVLLHPPSWHIQNGWSGPSCTDFDGLT